MKKVFDELYRLKFDMENEIQKLESSPDTTTDDFAGGEYAGKIKGRIEARQFDLLRIDQIIYNILKNP